MMKLALVLNLLFLVEVFGDGQLIVVSKPPNVEFRGHAEVDSDNVKDICSAILGFTTYDTTDWPGLYITSPFGFAESVAVIAVHGVPSLPIKSGHEYPYVADSPFDDIWAALEYKMSERFPYSGDNQTVMEFNLADDIRSIELNLNKGLLKVERPVVKHLKEEEDDNSSFLSEISTWMAVVDKVNEIGVAVDGMEDLYWFNLRGLHPVIDMNGDNSDVAAEAKEMVVAAVEKTKEVFERVYNNKTLVLVLVSDVAHTRRFRRAPVPEVVSDLKLAPVYDENYPVFFNIFLWFTIAFIMTIIATSMVTACMDPGRDSIIYRMTSTRMKKDN